MLNFQGLFAAVGPFFRIVFKPMPNSAPVVNTEAPQSALILTEVPVHLLTPCPSASSTQGGSFTANCHNSLGFHSLNIHYSVFLFTCDVNNYQHSTLLHVFPALPSAHGMSAVSRSKDKQVPLLAKGLSSAPCPPWLCWVIHRAETPSKD